jgi:epsilon-lactone hydrolase
MRSKSSPDLLAGIKQHMRQSFHFEASTVEEVRSREGEALSALPKLEGVVVEKTAVGHMHAEWVSAGQTVGNGVVLFFHGGAFISGSCATHRELAARLSQASGARVLVVEYRLAPEHPFPAANEDCLHAYRWLLEQGHSPQDIVVGGDSVGGTLTLMTLLAIRDQGLPRPAGAVLLSPHTDFIYFSSKTYVSHAQLDPTGSLRSSQLCAEYYAGSHEPRPAILSPLHMELAGLPELFIQVGDQEVLLGECQEFAERARSSGVDVELEVWEGMWCVFQQLAGILVEGQEAIGHAGSFIKRVQGRVETTHS